MPRPPKAKQPIKHAALQLFVEPHPARLAGASRGPLTSEAELLARLDAIQSHFLHKLEMTEEEIFLNFNFAPPKLRKNIGILGLLHKRILGEAHPIFNKLLPLHVDVFGLVVLCSSLLNSILFHNVP